MAKYKVELKALTTDNWYSKTQTEKTMFDSPEDS